MLFYIFEWTNPPAPPGTQILKLYNKDNLPNFRNTILKTDTKSQLT